MTHSPWYLLMAVILVVAAGCGPRPPVKSIAPTSAEPSEVSAEPLPSPSAQGPAYGLDPIGPDDAAPVVFQALKLAEQGSIDTAISMLAAHVKQTPNALYARLQLGSLLDYDGKPDAAVKAWFEGLSGYDADIMIWMAIGDLRFRQGTDGPTVSRRRGMVSYAPKKAGQDEEKFKKDHLEIAVESYKKVLDIDPTVNGALEALARSHALLSEYDKSIGYWKRLIALDPDMAIVRVALAHTLVGAGRLKEAEAVARDAMAREPRLAEAHEILADLYKERGAAEKAEDSARKAAFYAWLTPFSTTEFSEENWTLLQRLRGNGKGRDETLKGLIEKDTPVARDLLAAVIWHHENHGEVEDKAVEALEGWGAEEHLFGLIKHAESTCTVKGASFALARMKAEGIFDLLMSMLPGDIRPVHAMNIAGALDALGNPKAVPGLVTVLNPAFKGDDADPGTDMMMEAIGRESARARAAFALGAFDTAESREALNTCLKNEKYALYCHAALLRLTGDKAHEKPLKAALDLDDPDVYEFMLSDYLSKLPSKSAKKLAARWKARAEAATDEDEEE